MQNQTLKTIDMVAFVFLVVALLGFCSHIVSNSSRQSQGEKALKMAENISAQLMNVKIENLHGQMKNTDRMIASEHQVEMAEQDNTKLGPEGVIGIDPWGRPFQYRFLTTNSGEYEYLMVWSSGPDGEPKIDYKSVGLKQAARLLGSMELGDDVSFVSKTPKVL